MKLNLEILIVALALLSCKNAHLKTENENRVEKVFKNQKFKPEIVYYKVGERNIATLQIGDTSLPLTIFLHGSPGSGADYDEYLKDSTIYSKTRMIVIDRPGYGFSDFGKIEPNVVKQAVIIETIIEELKSEQKINLVAYSFGGPVVAKIAADIPQKINKMLLLAASLAPGEEKIFGISYWAIKEKVKDFVPTILRMANEEKMNHKTSLEEIAEDLKNITCLVYILHGDADNLIYYSNVNYAQEKMTNAQIEIYTVKGKGHGFFFKEHKLITT